MIFFSIICKSLGSKKINLVNMRLFCFICLHHKKCSSTIMQEYQESRVIFCCWIKSVCGVKFNHRKHFFKGCFLILFVGKIHTTFWYANYILFCGFFSGSSSEIQLNWNVCMVVKLLHDVSPVFGFIHMQMDHFFGMLYAN